jgi:hypothetical protein
VPGRPAAGRVEARGAEHALHRGPAHRKSLPGGELLGEVHIIEPGVAPPGEGENLGGEGIREAAIRVPAPIAVDEGRGPRLPQPHPEPPNLPGGQAQGFCRLPHRDPLPLQEGEHMHTSSFFWRQSHLSSSV